MNTNENRYNYWQDVWNREFEVEQEELAELAEQIRAEQIDFHNDLLRELAEGEKIVLV